MDITLALDILRTATDEALQSQYSEISLRLSILRQRLHTSPARIDISTPFARDSGRQSPPSTAGPSTDHYGHNIDGLSLSDNSQLPTVAVQHAANPTPEQDSPLSTAGPTTDRYGHNADSPSSSDRSELPIVAVKNGLHAKKVKTTVEKLVSAMLGHINWLLDAIHTDREIISYKRDTTIDLRMEDYRRVEGNKKPTNQEKLLRLLSMRSVAKEFTRETHGNNRLEAITAYIVSIGSGKNNPEKSNSSQFKGRYPYLSEFVKLHPSLSSYNDANRAINKGIKHLAFERVFRKTLEDFQLPNTSEAMSAILGLSMDDFKSLTYTQMPELVNALVLKAFASPQIVYKVEGEELDLPEAIRRIDVWFVRTQTRYNNVRMIESTSEYEGRRAKRGRYDNHTGGQQNSPYYSIYHRGSSNTTQPEPENQNEAPQLSQDSPAPIVPPLHTSERPRSEVNPLFENISLDELHDPFDYTFQGNPYSQQILTDIETQSVDYTTVYDPVFSQISAHLFDSSLTPIQGDFDAPRPNCGT